MKTYSFKKEIFKTIIVINNVLDNIFDDFTFGWHSKLTKNKKWRKWLETNSK